jgi:hypothetical protein
MTSSTNGGLCTYALYAAAIGFGVSPLESAHPAIPDARFRVALGFERDRA